MPKTNWLTFKANGLVSRQNSTVVSLRWDFGKVNRMVGITGLMSHDSTTVALQNRHVDIEDGCVPSSCLGIDPYPIYHVLSSNTRQLVPPGHGLWLSKTMSLNKPSSSLSSSYQYFSWDTKLTNTACIFCHLHPIGQVSLEIPVLNSLFCYQK